MADAATSIAAAAYQAFQAATEETAPTLTAEFATLVAAASNIEVQPHVRVYALNIIAQHGHRFEKSAVKTALESIVTLLAEEDESKAPQKLIVAAIDAFVGMCKGTAAKQDDLVRVATDLCVIIVLNKDGFSQAARDAAEAGLKELTSASLVGVVKKYLHLLSDEREKDEDDQLEKERAFAINRIGRLFGNTKALVEQWPEEAQTQIQSFLASVIPTAQKDELVVLCNAFTKLPAFGDGTFIVDKILKAKLDNARLFETLAVVGPFIPRTVTHPAIAEKLLSLVGAAASPAAAPAPAPKKGGKKSAAAKAAEAEAAATAAVAGTSSDALDISSDVTAAAAFLLAARTASAEIADKVADALFDALNKAIPALSEETDAAAAEGSAETSTAAPEGLPENLSAVEAIIIALATIAVKNPAHVIAKFANDESSIVARLTQTYKALGYFKKVFTFAVKKQQLDANPTEEEKREQAVTLTVIANLITLVGPLTTKHLPSTTIVPSWEKSLPLPRVAGKKSGRDSFLAAILPSNSKAGVAASASTTNNRDNLLATALPSATKKLRSESSNNKNSNSRNNNNKGGRRF